MELSIVVYLLLSYLTCSEQVKNVNSFLTDTRKSLSSNMRYMVLVEVYLKLSAISDTSLSICINNVWWLPHLVRTFNET